MVFKKIRNQRQNKASRSVLLRSRVSGRSKLAQKACLGSLEFLEVQFWLPTQRWRWQGARTSPLVPAFLSRDGCVDRALAFAGGEILLKEKGVVRAGNLGESTIRSSSRVRYGALDTYERPRAILKFVECVKQPAASCPLRRPHSAKSAPANIEFSIMSMTRLAVGTPGAPGCKYRTKCIYVSCL